MAWFILTDNYSLISKEEKYIKEALKAYSCLQRLLSHHGAGPDRISKSQFWLLTCIQANQAQLTIIRYEAIFKMFS